MGNYVKYRCKVLIGKRPSGLDHHVWYEHVDNLFSFSKFLDRKFSSWSQCEVIDRSSAEVLLKFTPDSRPMSKRIPVLS
jgi:hypothetical protein